jgi:hypothetical protein
MLDSTKRTLASATGKVVKPRNGWRLVAFVLLSALGLAFLASLDYGLDHGLWGEFIFAFVLVSMAIAILGHAISDRWWEARGISPPTILHAPFWAAVVLVALPFALLTLWAGVVVLLGLMLGSFFLVPLVLKMVNAPFWTEPSARLAALTTILGMLFFAYLFTADGGKDPVPAAVKRGLLPGADKLAHRFRPVLLFDSDELFTPVDIKNAIAAGNVATCRKTVAGRMCDKLASEDQIDQNADYLNFDLGPLGLGDSTGGAKSAMYYHVVDDRPENLYVDYWWFYAENPEPVGDSVLCRIGFKIPEISCFQHHGDWEGVTIVFAPCGTQPTAKTACLTVANRRLHVVQVNYAAHNGVKKQSWSRLEQMWSKRKLRTYGERPLVYVARNSHASYPVPCFKHCGREKSTNGKLPWGNNGETCETDEHHCVLPLPLGRDGQPALWAAFPGPWGSQRCILLGAYCDGGAAPKAPAFHRRYKTPGDPG